MVRLKAATRSAAACKMMNRGRAGGFARQPGDRPAGGRCHPRHSQVPWCTCEAQWQLNEHTIKTHAMQKRTLPFLRSSAASWRSAVSRASPSASWTCSSAAKWPTCYGKQEGSCQACASPSASWTYVRQAKWHISRFRAQGCVARPTSPSSQPRQVPLPGPGKRRPTWIQLVTSCAAVSTATKRNSRTTELQRGGVEGGDEGWEWEAARGVRRCSSPGGYKVADAWVGWVSAASVLSIKHPRVEGDEQCGQLVQQVLVPHAWLPTKEPQSALKHKHSEARTY